MTQTISPSMLNTFIFACELGPAIVQSVPVLVVREDDPNGEIIHATPLTHQMFGYEPGELFGKSIEELIPEGLIRDLHPKMRAEYVINPKVRTMNDGVFVRARRKDGTTFPIQISLCPRTVDGRRHVIACLTDVSRAIASVRAEDGHGQYSGS